MKTINFITAVACMCSLSASATNIPSEDEQQPKVESAFKSLVFFPKSIPAGTAEKVHVAFDTRVDFSWDKAVNEKSQSGFQGKYFNLMVYGEIMPGLSYNWRQRLNKFTDIGNDVFSATDWIYLTYKPTKNWAISGGKQVVAIGGYEYDAAPINIYYASLFWNNIACYQFGVSGSYISNSGNHSLMFQVTNSPYQKLKKSCYAYNLMWNGSMGVFSTIWSANMIEYADGRYANFIALGNRLDFGKVNIEFDYMNRYTSGQRFLFDDYSIIGKLQYSPCHHINIFAKGGYEKFKPVLGEPEAIKKPFYGAGVEVFPFKSYRNLRLHADWNMNHGAYGDNFGQRYQQLQIGVTWKIDILSVL